MYVSVEGYSFLTGLYCSSVSTLKQKHAQLRVHYQAEIISLLEFPLKK